MAIVYANASGEWFTNIEIWYSEGQPYEQVPQDGDYIYMNGYNVTFNSNINLPNSTISNCTCPYTGIGGGYLDQHDTTQRIIIANLELGSKLHSYNAYNSGKNKNWNITGNVTIIGGGYTAIVANDNWSSGTGSVTVNGNIIGDSSNSTLCQTQTCTINGDVTNCRLGDLSYSTNNTRTATVNGNIYNSNLGTTFITGNTTTNVNLSGYCDFSNSQYIISNCMNCNINGTLDAPSNYISTTIQTLNLNGTLNCNYPVLTSSYPIGTTNISQGSRITYSQECPLGWGELNAPADFEFEYNGSGVSTGAYMIVNKNLLSQSYPQPSYVVSGTTYGDSNQFTGTMTQPDESVVLKDYVYASGTKTGTLDTSSLDVPEDLYTQFNNITTKLSALQTRLSIADIIEALNQYTAVKVSDLASISIDKQDIKDALDEYHAVTEEYVAACLGENIGS